MGDQGVAGEREDKGEDGGGMNRMEEEEDEDDSKVTGDVEGRAKVVEDKNTRRQND